MTLGWSSCGSTNALAEETPMEIPGLTPRSRLVASALWKQKRGVSMETKTGRGRLRMAITLSVFAISLVLSSCGSDGSGEVSCGNFADMGPAARLEAVSKTSYKSNDFNDYNHLIAVCQRDRDMSLEDAVSGIMARKS